MYIVHLFVISNLNVIEVSNLNGYVFVLVLPSYVLMMSRSFGVCDGGLGEPAMESLVRCYGVTKMF